MRTSLRLGLTSSGAEGAYKARALRTMAASFIPRYKVGYTAYILHCKRSSSLQTAMMILIDIARAKLSHRMPPVEQVHWKVRESVTASGRMNRRSVDRLWSTAPTIQTTRG
jgi:hypothetical protein